METKYWKGIPLFSAILLILLKIPKATISIMISYKHAY